ncbi:PepSY domain-containing protein [Spongiibacter taiwanensis]|uniref:PepSY-associated TM helix domain-containing protein n=1 Tax=Spongiibacter taiwanensis TaxID=1748242 RepID=UPI0020356B38|nr:PepSY-associated TM helix domain-containing protein [Spongiibacter taiwanensis]USA42204.1 PepSY domain-containing protein [Spongiibacter taiwanensis]
MSQTRNNPPFPILRSLHRWCGLIVGVILLVAALSGSALAFKKPLIHSLVCPDASLPADYSPAHMLAQLEAIRQHGAYQPTTLIKAPNEKEPFWTLMDSGNTVLLHIDTLEPYRNNLWIIETLAFLHKLHVTLMAGLTGEILLLVAGIGGIGLCVTGLVIWWPGRRGFRWRWVFPKSIKSPLLLQYHRHSGAASALLTVVLLLTGSLMMWQIVVSPLLPKDPPTRVAAAVPARDHDATNVQAMFAQAVAEMPDGWPTYIRFGANERPDFSVRFRLPDEWHPNGRTSVIIERDSGDMLVSPRSDEASTARWLVNQLYPLHSGFGMGTLYSVAVFAGGLFMAWLAISGGWAYLRRRRLH